MAFVVIFIVAIPAVAYYLDASWHKQQHEAEVKLNAESRVKYPYYPFIHSTCTQVNNTFYYSTIMEFNNGQSVRLVDSFTDAEHLLQIIIKQDSLLPKLTKDIDNLQIPLPPLVFY